MVLQQIKGLIFLSVKGSLGTQERFFRGMVANNPFSTSMFKRVTDETLYLIQIQAQGTDTNE